MNPTDLKPKTLTKHDGFHFGNLGGHTGKKCWTRFKQAFSLRRVAVTPIKTGNGFPNYDPLITQLVTMWPLPLGVPLKLEFRIRGLYSYKRLVARTCNHIFV